MAGGLMMHPTPSPYPELGATYDELGSLLDRWDRGELDMPDEEFEQTCADLVDRLIEIGKLVDQYSSQMFVLAMAKYAAEARDAS